MLPKLTSPQYGKLALLLDPRGSSPRRVLGANDLLHMLLSSLGVDPAVEDDGVIDDEEEDDDEEDREVDLDILNP